MKRTFIKRVGDKLWVYHMKLPAFLRDPLITLGIKLGVY